MEAGNDDEDQAEAATWGLVDLDLVEEFLCEDGLLCEGEAGGGLVEAD